MTRHALQIRSANFDSSSRLAIGRLSDLLDLGPTGEHRVDSHDGHSTPIPSARWRPTDRTSNRAARLTTTATTRSTTPTATKADK